MAPAGGTPTLIQGRTTAGSKFCSASVFSRYELPWDEAETLLLWGRTLAGVGQLGRAQERFGASDQVYRRCGVGERWLARLRAG